MDNFAGYIIHVFDSFYVKEKKLETNYLPFGVG